MRLNRDFAGHGSVAFSPRALAQFVLQNERGLVLDVEIAALLKPDPFAPFTKIAMASKTVRMGACGSRRWSRL